MNPYIRYAFGGLLFVFSDLGRLSNIRFVHAATMPPGYTIEHYLVWHPTAILIESVQNPRRVTKLLVNH